MTKTNPTKESNGTDKYKSLHRASSGRFNKTGNLNLKCRFCDSKNIVKLVITLQRKERKQDTNARIVILSLHQQPNL